MKTTPEDRTRLLLNVNSFREGKDLYGLEISPLEIQNLLVDFKALWEYTAHLLAVHEDRTPELADAIIQSIAEDYRR